LEQFLYPRKLCYLSRAYETEHLVLVNIHKTVIVSEFEEGKFTHRPDSL